MKFDMVVIKSTKDAGTGAYHHDNTPFGVDFSGTHLPVSGLGEAMGSNSLRAVLAMGAALAFSAAPAHAELVNAKNPATIKAILESQGWPATLVSKPGEDPYLESNRNGLKFVVLFMNCTENKNCKTLQYYMGFSDAKNVALDRFNEWNRTKRFARAYRDEEGDPVLEMDVDVDFAGIPRENVGETFNTWASLMDSFREFIFEK